MWSVFYYSQSRCDLENSGTEEFGRVPEQAALSKGRLSKGRVMTLCERLRGSKQRWSGFLFQTRFLYLPSQTPCLYSNRFARFARARCGWTIVSGQDCVDIGSCGFP